MKPKQDGKTRPATEPTKEDPGMAHGGISQTRPHDKAHGGSSVQQSADPNKHDMPQQFANTKGKGQQR
jgi:hypothetical protein